MEGALSLMEGVLHVMEGEQKIPHWTHKRELNMKQLLLLAILVTFTTGVSASCLFEGIEYPEGTVKGPLVCGSDGYWRPK